MTQTQTYTEDLSSINQDFDLVKSAVFKAGRFPKSIHGKYYQEDRIYKGTKLLAELGITKDYYQIPFVASTVVHHLAFYFPKNLLDAFESISEDEQQLFVDGLADIVAFLKEERLFTLAEWIEKRWHEPCITGEVDYSPSPHKVVDSPEVVKVKEFAKRSAELTKHINSCDRDLKNVLTDLVRRARLGRRVSKDQFLINREVLISGVANFVGVRWNERKEYYELIAAKVDDIDEFGETERITKAAYCQATKSFTIGRSTVIRSAFGSQVVFDDA